GTATTSTSTEENRDAVTRSPRIDVRILLPRSRRNRRHALQTLRNPVARVRRVDHVIDPASGRGVDRLRAVVGGSRPALEFREPRVRILDRRQLLAVAQLDGA